ncbi:MAG: glycosyltransferase family 39 protein [Candidatus Competibacteraceae bacterium]
MTNDTRWIGSVVFLTLAALALRLFLALGLPNDDPDDGRVYARIARNVIEHGVYSSEDAPPYVPTYIRVPSYPLLLAGIYSVFGHDANHAVRVCQALIDTATCWMAALLAMVWAPAGWSRERRLGAALAALVLAALCPFIAIYVATILTETFATFLLVSLALVTSLALRARNPGPAIAWWLLTGILGGIGTLLRPDSGLFVTASGATLVLVALNRILEIRRNREPIDDVHGQTHRILARTFISGSLLVIGFIATLAPWAVRNWQVFHVFQPLAPASATMPEEFVPLGYLTWVGTWITDERYAETVVWPMEVSPIPIEQFPDAAFDSPQERERVIALLDQYNHPAAPESSTAEDTTGAASVPDAAGTSAEPQEQDEENSDQQDENDTDEPQAEMRMTPEIDAGFAQLAQERASRHPLRTYLVLPAQRAISLWFSTHSRYYPFGGHLFPLSDLDQKRYQHIWLPAFAFLTWVYSILAAAGCWVLWKNAGSRRWLLLFGLLIIPRLVFLSTLPNSEARYVIEYFPLLATAGGLAIAAFMEEALTVQP